MMKWLKNFYSRAAVLKELFVFLWKNKLWWMIPIVVVFLLLALLILFTQSSAVVPFIYTLF
jgi:hypothetical protein